MALSIKLLLLVMFPTKHCDVIIITANHLCVCIDQSRHTEGHRRQLIKIDRHL